MAEVQKQANGLAVTALVLGIVAFIFGWTGVFGLLLGIAAIVFGIIALNKKQNKAFGLVGIIGGAIAAVTGLIFTVIAAAIIGTVPAGTIQEAVDEAASGIQETQQTQTEEAVRPMFKEGTYKVGSDMPAGEYRLVALNSGYFQIASDSTGEFDSLIANDNFSTQTIVSVADGQYLQITRAIAYPIDDAPEIDITKEGMFKVGKDIQAGEYKVRSTGSGYLQVSTDSTHGFESIVSNNNFEGETYITVADGQYLTLNRAVMIQ